ncbi:MAG: hypothetical protein IPK61_10225 [Saprospiraceae bacterium]|nr:hypothetical protein [Saprospiraceae bacterium]
MTYNEEDIQKRTSQLQQIGFLELKNYITIPTVQAQAIPAYNVLLEGGAGETVKEIARNPLCCTHLYIR